MAKLKQCKACGAEISKSAKACPKCGQKNGGGCLKILLIAIGVIVVLGVFASLGNKDDSDTAKDTDTKTTESNSAAETKKEDENKIKAGSYKVGQDMPAGEYIVISGGLGLGYVEVTKDSSGTLDSIVMNDNVQGNTIITVKDGQYVNLKSADMYAFDKAPSLKPEDGIYKDGMYKVGVHIPAGEYKVVPDSNMGYVEVDKDSFGSLGSIITNDNLQAEKYITVQDGQYLKIKNASININK